MTHWTNEELQILKDNYSKYPASEVAILLNRSYRSILRKAFCLKLISYHHSIKLCTYPECNSKTDAGNLCNKHYKRNIGRTEKYKKMKRDYYVKNKKSIVAYRNTRKHILEYRYVQGKNEAKSRNKNFTLTLDEYKIIMTNICHYCDTILTSGFSLDRKDNNIGYTKNNVVPCCSKCNTFKRDLLTYAEMLKVISVLKELRNKNSIWE